MDFSEIKLQTEIKSLSQMTQDRTVCYRANAHGYASTDPQIVIGLLKKITCPQDQIFSISQIINHIEIQLFLIVSIITSVTPTLKNIPAPIEFYDCLDGISKIKWFVFLSQDQLTSKSQEIIEDRNQWHSLLWSTYLKIKQFPQKGEEYQTQLLNQNEKLTKVDSQAMTPQRNQLDQHQKLHQHLLYDQWDHSIEQKQHFSTKIKENKKIKKQGKQEEQKEQKNQGKKQKTQDQENYEEQVQQEQKNQGKDEQQKHYKKKKKHEKTKNINKKIRGVQIKKKVLGKNFYQYILRTIKYYFKNNSCAKQQLMESKWYNQFLKTPSKCCFANLIFYNRNCFLGYFVINDFKELLSQRIAQAQQQKYKIMYAKIQEQFTNKDNLPLPMKHRVGKSRKNKDQIEDKVNKEKSINRVG